MSGLSDPRQVRELLQRHGMRLSKGLGQNFLINPGVCPRMAREGVDPGCGVLEIGPGVGVLTWELAQTAQKVVAVELDRRLFPILGETLRDCPNVELVQGDAMELDLRRLLEEKFGGQKVCVCANLPYYITSPLIMRLLEGGLPLSSITVMVQKEAAQRLCAPPGVRACGAVSVGVHYRSRPRVLFGVGRGSFLPPPKVDSAVIRFDMLETPAVAVRNEKLFFQIARGAFAQRRKTAANSISGALGVEKPLVERALEGAGAGPGARAEQLTLEQLAALANALAEEIQPG
ncbi:MAG: ribosomal RNA small subunit methyltransferase A [Acutalibacter sp.]|nr:ribosomal RNA small subunit methyltransferase A [Acutalibacter sp.]